MTYEYTQDLSTLDWEVKIDPVHMYGFWEEKATGAGGPLWFSASMAQLIDGRYGLPEEVAAILRSHGYDATVMEPDNPLPPCYSGYSGGDRRR